MFEKILVVCDGNICRSPTAAAVMRTLEPNKEVFSAGIIGLTGRDMDACAREVALLQGLNCGPHVAQKLTVKLCQKADVILVMEERQRKQVVKLFPEVCGKIFLLSHWNGRHDIPDPYRRGEEVFESVYLMICEAGKAWSGNI